MPGLQRLSFVPIALWQRISYTPSSVDNGLEVDVPAYHATSLEDLPERSRLRMDR